VPHLYTTNSANKDTKGTLNVTHQLVYFQYNDILVYNVNFKTLKNTPTCFNLNRSSSGSSPVPR